MNSIRSANGDIEIKVAARLSKKLSNVGAVIIVNTLLMYSQYSGGMASRRVPSGQSEDNKGPQFIWDLGPTMSPNGRPRQAGENPAILLNKKDASRETPMKRALKALILTLIFAAPAAAEKHQVKDEGGFAATGRFVEFQSRYSWQKWKIDFDFNIDPTKRKLSRKSKLKLKITRRNGRTWSYTCKAKREGEMWANINRLYGKGTSAVVQCRIPPKKFAKAVGLDRDLVGEPTLVFQVMINNGKARAGVQKGLYFLVGGQIEASPMNQYASQSGDPSNLGVLFASSLAPSRHHPNYQPSSRYIP
jgi:opacity protein-like surface antigen